MTEFLQLDRSGWIYARGRPGFIMIHRCGARIGIDPHKKICRVFDPASRSLMLDFVRTTPFQNTPDGWITLWRDLDAAAGPEAQADFDAMYQFVRQAAIAVNFTETFSVRRNKQGPLWGFGANFSGLTALGRGDSPFGPLEPLVQAALARVAHVAVPVVYCEKRRLGGGSPFGQCVWNVQSSAHERLAAISYFRQAGVVFP